MFRWFLSILNHAWVLYMKNEISVRVIILVTTEENSLKNYGWNHRNTTWTSIQISQLLEWVRPCKWVRSKGTGHVHSPKYTITRHIWYLLISQQIFRKTSIQISDGENSLMRKFWWKIFLRGIFDHEKSLYHMVTRTHREIRFLWVFFTFVKRQL